MKILLSGSTGYIGSRLLPLLVEMGHTVYCLVRDPYRVNLSHFEEGSVKAIQGDLLDLESLNDLPQGLDAAYYLVHSMGYRQGDFSKKDRLAAENFVQAINKTHCKQIIYLSGLTTDEKLSKHLSSRREVEGILATANAATTILKAGIIVGSGSASFEIMRDLVEKLPIMIAPRWVKSLIQPIFIKDVEYYLSHVLGNQNCYNRTFDIGGPEVMTYKEMLLRLAKVRNLKRLIIDVPVLTPKLSSYWLFFITKVNFYLARSLVESLKNNAICTDNSIETVLPHKSTPFEEAVEKAFDKIGSQSVISSWKDSFSSSGFDPKLLKFTKTPTHGCYKLSEERAFDCSEEKVKDLVFNIGGDTGWYYMDKAWKLRGLIDRFLGGIGLRRGRTKREDLRPGDALDFWRVIKVDEENAHLILYAEMKIPGEAWLEFEIIKKSTEKLLKQTATFRPRGVFGRFYWFILYPIHILLFKGLLKAIIRRAK